MNITLPANMVHALIVGSRHGLRVVATEVNGETLSAIAQSIHAAESSIAAEQEKQKEADKEKKAE